MKVRPQHDRQLVRRLEGLATARRPERPMTTMSRGVHAPGRTQCDELEGLFGEQRAILQARLQTLRDTGRAVMSDVRDADEESADLMDLGVSMRVLELGSQVVRGIETALWRRKAGALGVCADCRIRISRRRLEAVPFAERCRDCQLQFQDRSAKWTRSQ